MASKLTRCYNRNAPQLREAIGWAFQSSFPGAFMHEVAPWHFMLKRGMHWPLTSYGEQVELHVTAPGSVEISSR